MGTWAASRYEHGTNGTYSPTTYPTTDPDTLHHLPWRMATPDRHQREGKGCAPLLSGSDVNQALLGGQTESGPGHRAAVGRGRERGWEGVRVKQEVWRGGAATAYFPAWLSVDTFLEPRDGSGESSA